LPVSVAASDWDCTTGPHPKGRDGRAVRLGLRYVSGLRENVGRLLARERARQPFAHFEDLCRRVPLNPLEARTLAELGACAALGATRREALWQIEAAQRAPGTLYEELAEPRLDPDAPSP